MIEIMSSCWFDAVWNAECIIVKICDGIENADRCNFNVISVDTSSNLAAELAMCGAAFTCRHVRYVC